MGQILIRNLDDALIADYKRAASDHGRSLEAELRDALACYRPLAMARRAAAIDRFAAIRATTPDRAQTPAEHLVREDRDGFRDA